MELADVMHTVAECEDVRQEQKVRMTRNGSEYTILLSKSTGQDYDFARADFDQETAEKVFVRIVRAFVRGKYTWAARKRLLKG